MRISSTGAALALAATLLAAPAAGACAFPPGEARGTARAAEPLAALPDGITRGWVDCPGEARRPLVVWTLTVDEGAGYVGVRDAPLFSSLPSNPLVAVGGVGYGADARFSLFMRRDRAGLAPPSTDAPDRRPAFRLFGTLCPERAADALDCRAGARRVKARVDVRDHDGDGALDLARHEVSVFRGGRLQVLRFAVAHEPRLHDVVARWIAALDLAEG